HAGTHRRLLAGVRGRGAGGHGATDVRVHPAGRTDRPSLAASFQHSLTPLSALGMIRTMAEGLVAPTAGPALKGVGGCFTASSAPRAVGWMTSTARCSALAGLAG